MDQSVQTFEMESPQYRPRLLSFSSAAGVAQEFEIAAIADDGEYEEQTVTCPATAGATQSDYFVVYNKAGEYAAVWLDLNDAGADPGNAPTGAIFLAADYQVEVNISTLDTAAQVAAAVVAALGVLLPDVTITDNLDGTISFESDLLGPVAAPEIYNADDSGNGSFLVAVANAGVASALQNKTFNFSAVDGDDDYAVVDYYGWMNVGAEGVDPAISGKTGVEIAIDPSDADTDVADAIEAALDALDDLSASAAAEVVTVSGLFAGEVPEAEDVDSGVVITINEAGSDAEMSVGQFDGEIAQTGVGVYELSYNEQFKRAPELAVISKSDNRVPRIVSSAVGLAVIEMQDLSGGAAADGDFGVLVLGSDNSDAIRQL